MKKSLLLGAAFALVANAGFAKDDVVCDVSQNNFFVKSFADIVEKPAPAGNALPMIMGFELDGVVHKEISALTDSGAVAKYLNKRYAQNGVSFDRNHIQIFSNIASVVAFVCFQEDLTMLDAAQKLKALDGIQSAAPDSPIYEVPLILEKPTFDL